MGIDPARGFSLETAKPKRNENPPSQEATEGRGAEQTQSMKLVEYIKETRAELKHVSWPTRKQAIVFTVVVIVISLITAVYLGAFDYVFTTILKLII